MLLVLLSSQPKRATLASSLPAAWQPQTVSTIELGGQVGLRRPTWQAYGPLFFG
jgi:hypothetical protein